LITARYFSSCPSDSTSRWTPCPPENCRLVASGPPWLVSGFRFRARLGFSIPFTFSGPRGVTPAFGYGTPHSSARGTSTLLSNALLSAHYGPVRHPLAGHRLPGFTGYTVPCSADFAAGRGGLLQLLSASLSSCCRYYPARVSHRISQIAACHAALAPLSRARPLGLTFSGPPLRSLALRPDDSLTVPGTALSMDSPDSVSLLPTTQATGL
jgi:hypothetical protein